jgi:apolipoprotein D and lipocalin family protein
MRMRVFAPLAFAIALATSDSLALAQSLRVVQPFDLDRYAGKWYEVARLPNKFQIRCSGDVVAHYAVRPDARVDVVNQCRESDGRIAEARGIARKAGDGKNSAMLEVRFAPAFLSFLPSVWGDYWVIGLGSDYTWAVVGAPNREYLWILSRTPNISPSGYEQAVEIARGNGFDVSRLVRTSHRGR